MIYKNIFGIEDFFIGNLDNKVQDIEANVTKYLSKKEKKYSDMLVRYMILTGNIELLNDSNKKKVITLIEESIKEEIFTFLKDYKEYNKNLLILNLENKYGLSKESISSILEDLKKQKKIKIKGNNIFILKKSYFFPLRTNKFSV